MKLRNDKSCVEKLKPYKYTVAVNIKLNRSHISMKYRSLWSKYWLLAFNYTKHGKGRSIIQL